MYPGIKTPVILGSDGAGVVTDIGQGVESSWRQKEVIINPGLEWGTDRRAQSKAFHILGMPMDGTFATEVLVPETQLHDMPAHLNWHEAAALPLAGVTAYRAVFTQGRLQAGETVLISGVGGGVATFALQYAVKAGAEVWVTSSSARKIQRAVELGARGGFDYANESWPKEFAKVAQAAHLIVDSAGGKGYRQLLAVAAPGGRIVNYGATVGTPEKLDMFKLFWSQLHLIGSTMGSPEDFDNMLAFVEHHRIKPVVDEVLPLEQGNAAIEKMASSPQFGKLVLEIKAN
jgi:NADPH:quinone reductase-like Zn-dependent oxidoreductase